MRSILPDGSWRAFINRVDLAPTTFLMVNAKSYKQTAPQMHAMLMLNNLSDDRQPICITQTIPKVPPGKYNLTYTVYAKYNFRWSQFVIPFLQIEKDNYLQIGDDPDDLSPGVEIDFTITSQMYTQFYTNANLTICKYDVNPKSNNSRQFYIRNISFIRLNDTCDPSVASSQLMIDGTYGCVPHDVVMKGINCDKYAKTVFKKVQSYECAYCDPLGTTPNLVFINGSYKACVQQKVPGAIGYKIVENKWDSSKKRLLIPVCEKVYNVRAKLAIPNHQTSKYYRDETSSPCRDDFGAVTIQNVANGKYVPAECAQGFQLIDLINSTESKGCVDPKLTYFDSNCIFYTYNKVTKSFLCQACASNFVLIHVKVGLLTAEAVNDCVYSKQLIQYCEMYFFNGDLLASIYQCAPDGCAKGKIPTYSLNKCGDSIKNCQFLDNDDLSKCAVCFNAYVSINGICTCLPQKLSKLRNEKC